MITQTLLRKLLPLFLSLWAWPHSAHAYYDPGVQRWISRDPLSDINSLSGRHPMGTAETLPWSLNLYEYSGNTPLFLFDPDGRNPVVIIVAGVPIAIGEILLLYGASSLAVCMANPPCRQALQNLIAETLSKVQDFCKPNAKEKSNSRKVTCVLMPSRSDEAYKCVYACENGKFYVTRPPGKYGCPDVINIVIPNN